MGNQAKVSSVEALDTFRASLIIFLTKARRFLDDARDEARQTRMWLQYDSMIHWENEIRRRSRLLSQAEQEFTSAHLSKNNENALAIRKAAMEKAKRALDEAEERMRHVKQWIQNFDSTADPFVKRMEGIKQFLDVDMPKAISYIVALEKTLSAYAESSSSESAPPSRVPPPSAPETKKTL